MPFSSISRVSRKVEASLGPAPIGRDTGDDAAGDGGAGGGIDDQEVPVPGTSAKASTADGATERDPGDGDVVDGGGLRRLRRERLQVEQRLDLDRRDWGEVGRRAQQITCARIERCLPQPHEARLDVRRHCRLAVGGGEHGAARDVDIGVELESDGLALLGELKVAAHGGDAQDVRALAAERIR